MERRYLASFKLHDSCMLNHFVISLVPPNSYSSSGIQSQHAVGGSNGGQRT
jgi:hypothetical protein